MDWTEPGDGLFVCAASQQYNTPSLSLSVTLIASEVTISLSTKNYTQRTHVDMWIMPHWITATTETARNVDSGPVGLYHSYSFMLCVDWSLIDCAFIGSAAYGSPQWLAFIHTVYVVWNAVWLSARSLGASLHVEVRRDSLIAGLSGVGLAARAPCA